MFSRAITAKLRGREWNHFGNLGVAVHSVRCTVCTDRPRRRKGRAVGDLPSTGCVIASKAFEVHFGDTHLIKPPVRCWGLGEDGRYAVAEILRATLATSPERPRTASKTRKVRDSVATRMAVNRAGVAPCPSIIPSPFLLHSLPMRDPHAKVARAARKTCRFGCSLGVSPRFAAFLAAFRLSSVPSFCSNRYNQYTHSIT